MSPTFTISLSGVRGSFQAAKPADPDMSHSISPVPGTPRLPSKSPAITPAGLSPFSRAEDLPITSKSTELQNRMIDEQLELLGELFPKQVNHALQAKRSKAPGSPSGVEERTEKLSADETSDFHVSPVSEALALSSDWPKLPEASQSVVASQRASLISGEAVVDHSVEQSTKSPNLSPTADRPLIKRRSLAPTLRVNTVESQQYATKELKLIRKMKEEGRMKSDNKSKPVRQSGPAGHRQIEPDQETLVVPKNHANEESDKSERTKANTNRTDASNETTKSLLKPEDGPMKARRNSADSTVSHIVWSAVVEKFSEMAQEIAGVDPPREKVSNHNADSAIPVSSNPISPSATATCPISSKLEMRNENTASDVPPSPQVGSQDLENVAQEAKTSITEKAGVSSTEVRCEETDTQLNTVETASNAIPTVPLTKDSDSPATGSIMKKGHGAGLVDDGEMSDTPSGKSNKHNVIKLKRGKTVRVQSHHASLNVEGDYAAFLKKAIVEHERDSDATSVRSGKSNRSGRSAAWSTKSGVENGCFRRGSMRSIKTGKTIATVGDVPIRDLSRGARFRHPNPFFSQQHGFRKIKAPHQAGPGLLRRKGSKIVRLSVFEGRSTQDISRHTGPKRLSDDGETLGSTLARLKVDKRKAATPLIGELSFENDEPVKARTQTGSSTKRSPDPQTFSQAPLSSANVAAYAATTVGVSGRTERGPALANLACAASAYVSGALDKPPSNLNQNTTGYPFPSVPASLPPVPMVTMRGFAPKGSPGTGLPALPSVPGSVLSTFSVMSASRANILGAQMRGAQMLGASQSNISIASNRSAASPKRTRIKQGTHQQSPYPATHSRKPSQATPARTPLTQPMSRVEDNFISMTPARSDMSIKSARSLDREQREHMPEQFQAQSKAQAYYQATPSSLLTHPVLPEEMRASYRMKNAMRPSTAPLPPLPSDVASVNPLPLRTTGGLETADLSQSRLSTHRPLKPLTVDTDAAKEQARLQRLAKQALAEQKQKLMMQQGSDRTAVNPHSLATEARDLDEMQMQMQMPFKPTKQVPGRFEAEDAPKTGNSFSEKMSAIFTPPKRPFRKDSGPELPLRVPRPPSAGPVDLSHFATNNAGNRQSTTSTSASSTQSKSKGMKLFGGLSKIRKN